MIKSKSLVIIIFLVLFFLPSMVFTNDKNSFCKIEKDKYKLLLGNFKNPGFNVGFNNT